MRLSTSMRGLDDPFGITSKLLSTLIGQTTPGATASGGGYVPGGVPPSNNVVTSVSTQVSPQISPVFTQQTNPSNSPVIATPITGAMPGFDRASGVLPTGTSVIPAVPMNYNGLALAGLALLGLAVVLKSRRKMKGKR